MDLDIQSVVDLIGILAKPAASCGVIFGLASWAMTFFFDCVFPFRKKE